MRGCRLLLLATGVALSGSAVAFEPNVGTWEYDSPRVWLAVTLRPDGSCLVGAMLKKGLSGGLFANCAYSIQGEVVRLEWKHRIGGETPEASRLIYDALADALVIDGEPNRILKRKKQGKK